jgi:hypothetical protein
MRPSLSRVQLLLQMLWIIFLHNVVYNSDKTLERQGLTPRRLMNLLEKQASNGCQKHYFYFVRYLHGVYQMNA